MNIKEHIEAGHYPKDEKGRALVPTHTGHTAVIAATDRPIPSSPLLGWMLDGRDDGGVRTWPAEGGSVGGCDLLPPPHRKVKVTYFAEVERSTGQIVAVSNVGRSTNDGPARWICVVLTGEYEEPWA